jgi:hypothetical protein
MNISLKNTRINHQNSEETLAFNALLCNDKIPFAEVSNDGRGGENRYRPLGDSMDWIFNHALITAFREWCSNQPPVYDKESGNTYNFSADIFVNDCLTEHVGNQRELVVSI